MRTRVLVATVTLAVLVVASAVVVALSQGNRNPATSRRITVDVSRLAPGGVQTTQYDVPGANGTPAPVFLVDVPHTGFLALLGRSTHLGCSVRWVAAPSYKRFEHDASVAFEDPCGGSLFALDGACIGGPCPRGLDRFATHTIGRRLQVNLDAIVDGPPRDPTAQLNPGMP